MTEDEYKYAQRQLNILGVLYGIACICILGWGAYMVATQ